MFNVVPKLTRAAETIVTCYNIGHSFDVYAQRLERIRKNMGEEAYKLLKAHETVSDGSPVFCKLHWEDTQAARTLRLSVDEFEKNHPEHAEELEATIAYQREVKRNYLQFGVKPNNEISEKLYLEILEEIGIPANIAKSTLNTALKLSEYLKKKKKSDKPLSMLMD